MCNACRQLRRAFLGRRRTHYYYYWLRLANIPRRRPSWHDATSYIQADVYDLDLILSAADGRHQVGAACGACSAPCGPG
jgi:hypothetical protein